MKIAPGPILTLAIGAAISGFSWHNSSAAPAQAAEPCTELIQNISGGVQSVSSPCPAPVVPRTKAVVPVFTPSANDTIYTKISDGVATRIPITPVFAPPIDTIKLQIANRMNSGILSGKLTDGEANEVRGALDQLSLLENNLKLSYGGVNELIVANLMPKYHMTNQRLTDLMSNSNTADYMPNPENRRAALQTSVKYHTAAGNLTLGESEQLLASLNGLSEEYAAFRASGDTVTADELEQIHLDLFNINKKLNDRLKAPLAKMVPEVVLHENELLATIERGLASHALTADEGACLIRRYNELALLGRAIGGDAGYQSQDMHELIAKLDSMQFVLDRQIRDRQVAGQSLRY